MDKFLKRKAEAAPPEAESSLTKAHKSSWELVDGSCFVRRMEVAKSTTKVAGFDLDSTLVETRSGSKFAATADDWQWFAQTVPAKIQELESQGFAIVIFTNQNGIKSAVQGAQALKVKGRVDQVVGAIDGCSVGVFASCQKDKFRKPDTGMWDLMTSMYGFEPDLSESFYCGDAAGRSSDFSDSDKRFAEAVGVRFVLPEDPSMFGPSDVNKRSAVPVDGPNGELVACFLELSNLEKKAGSKSFITGAYKKVAQKLAGLAEKVTSGKEAQKLDGIGKASAEKIDEWLTSGKIHKLEELRKRFPE